jgi:hypothetical protein
MFQVIQSFNLNCLKVLSSKHETEIQVQKMLLGQMKLPWEHENREGYLAPLGFVKDIVLQLLERNPAHRMTAGDCAIACSSFVSQDFSQVQTMNSMKLRSAASGSVASPAARMPPRPLGPRAASLPLDGRAAEYKKPPPSGQAHVFRSASQGASSQTWRHGVSSAPGTREVTASTTGAQGDLEVTNGSLPETTPSNWTFASRHTHFTKCESSFTSESVA